MNIAELEMYLRAKGVFTVAEVQQRFNVGYAVVRQAFKELEAAGKIYLESGITFKWVVTEPKGEKVARVQSEEGKGIWYVDEDDDDIDLDELMDDDDDDEDVEDILNLIKNSSTTTTAPKTSEQQSPPKIGDVEVDILSKRALRFWLEKQAGRASIASIQRNLGIGFNRAGRLVDALQKLGYIEEYDNNCPSSRPLRVLITLQDLDRLFPDFPD